MQQERSENTCESRLMRDKPCMVKSQFHVKYSRCELPHRIDGKASTYRQDLKLRIDDAKSDTEMKIADLSMSPRPNLSERNRVKVVLTRPPGCFSPDPSAGTQTKQKQDISKSIDIDSGPLKDDDGCSKNSQLSKCLENQLSLKQVRAFKIGNYQETLSRLSSRVQPGHQYSGNILENLKNKDINSGYSSPRRGVNSVKNTTSKNGVPEFSLKEEASNEQKTPKSAGFSLNSESIPVRSLEQQNSNPRLLGLSTIARQVKSYRIVNRNSLQTKPSSFRLINNEKQNLIDIDRISNSNCDSSSVSAISEHG